MTDTDKFLLFVLALISIFGFLAYQKVALDYKHNQGNYYPQIKALTQECPLAKDYFQKRVFEETPLSAEDVTKAKVMCDKAVLFTELNK